MNEHKRENFICEKANELLLAAKRQTAAGYYFPHVAFHLQNQITRLTRMPEYTLVQNINDVLTPLNNYLENLQNIDNKLKALFQTVCSKAKPGVIVEDFIITEINKLRKEPLFEQMIELGASSLARYINSAENIRLVHELVMNTRVDACKAELMKDLKSYTALELELKKITNFRVRRNVLSRLFQSVLYDKTFFPTNQSSQQEQCLLTLQQKYLHTIYRQIERMTLGEAIPFLTNLHQDPMFQPLQKRNWFSKRNNDILAEFEYLLMNCSSHALPDRLPYESPPLYHIDCPIEQDILGEVTRRLVDAIQHRVPKWQSFNIINEITEQTYTRLLAPDFKCEKTLEDFVVDSEQHANLVSSLEAEKDVAFRLDRILELYEFVTHTVKFKTSFWADTCHLTLTEQEKAIIILQKCYLQALEIAVERLSNVPEYEKTWWHEGFLKSAPSLALFNYPLLPKQSKKAREQLERWMKR